MNDAQLQVGTLVSHPRKPEWGPGKVVRVEPDALHVIWRDLPDAAAKKLITSAVQLSRLADQSDPILDNLPPLIEKNGKLSLPRERMTFTYAVDAFLSKFPGGFYDAAYIGDSKTGEWQYKMDAHHFCVQHLGREKLRALLSGDATILAHAIMRVVNQVNLMYPTEKAAFRDALADADSVRKYASALADLLDSPAITEEAFEPYLEVVHALPAARGRVASWPVATLLPFLAQPDRHLFLKPEVTNNAAEALGFNLNYRSELNWLTYKSLLRMGDIYKEKLANLRPRNMIDIQSFFWVSCGGYEA